jgi:NAD(P)H-hydrate epimerase
MITTSEMRELEEWMGERGVTKLELMERAGKGIAKVMEEHISRDKKIVFVCYHGNNGGDGFVAARYLLKEGYAIKVVFIGEEEKLSEESKVNYEKLKALKVELKKDLPLIADVLVDCMLGIGIEGELKDPIKSFIRKINDYENVYVVAVDIPTGINPETGEVAPERVRADLIITIHDVKPGLERYKLNVEVVDIGMPKEEDFE